MSDQEDGREKRNRAVFLDRDGTINVDRHYVHQIEEFEYIPGAMEALRMFQSAGYRLIVITNQSGIARGYFTEEDYQRLDQWMKADLAGKGVHLTATYDCPHLPDAPLPRYRAVCSCRKPGLGMFQKAAKERGIDIEKSIAVGDRLRDLSICSLGCRGFLVGHSESEEVIARVKHGEYGRVEYCGDLRECAKRVLDKCDWM